jgi:DNA-binding transcriptional ArsR family regulator
MDGWWSEVEAVVGRALEHSSEVCTGEIALRLGVSEAAAASLLGVLAGAGVVRITRIGAGNRSVAVQALEKYAEPGR